MTVRHFDLLREAPAIVAESLIEIGDPVRASLDPGPIRPAGAVAAAIARAALPPEATDPAPLWLRLEQIRSCRRGLAAVRQHGAVLLADPVGSGKTFVALAIATALRAGSLIEALVPAVLIPQWQRVARALGLPLAVTSHERVSRGEWIPRSGPVIIDESHRFRNPSTRRYRAAAPLLVERPLVLVTATPLVNRAEDLAHQLLLGVRDDTLRLQGIRSLRAALATETVPPALGMLVAAERGGRLAGPGRSELVLDDWDRDDPDQARMLGLLDRLRLSRDPGIAALVRGSLVRALASSPAALRASLRRYALLVEHAAMARAAGRRVSRRDVAREVGPGGDQLVLWALLDDPSSPAELALGDRRLIPAMLRILDGWSARGDRKAELLRTLLADRAPTLLFTAWTETVGYLQRTLRLPGTAWVTGERAGLGPVRYPRRAVLAAFDPASTGRLHPDLPAPWLLLATDVAAEGLNLQRVARVIHYDLPWTPVRLEQRDGRALRMGSIHPEVAVVRFDPPAALERRLGLGPRLTRKAALPARVGLGASLSGAWRGFRLLEADWDSSAAEIGWAAVAADQPALVAAFSAGGAGHDPPALMVVTTDGHGGWTGDPTTVALRLRAAREGVAVAISPTEVEAALDRLAPVVRDRLRLLNAGRWLSPPADPLLQTALRVARARLEQARRERRAGELGAADRVLAFLARGHSAGEAMIAGRVAREDAAAWHLAAARAVDDHGAGPGPRPRLLGLLLFLPDRLPL